MKDLPSILKAKSMSCVIPYTLHMQKILTCRYQLTQDSYQISPSAQLGRGRYKLVDASFLLNWALLQISKCRTRTQVFQAPCLSSCSAASKYISNFLRVTGMSPQPINSANVLISLSVQKARDSRGSFSSWKWRRHREWNWHGNVLEAFADIHAPVPQNSMKNNLL